MIFLHGEWAKLRKVFTVENRTGCDVDIKIKTKKNQIKIIIHAPSF